MYEHYTQEEILQHAYWNASTDLEKALYKVVEDLQEELALERIRDDY